MSNKYIRYWGLYISLQIDFEVGCTNNLNNRRDILVDFGPS